MQITLINHKPPTIQMGVKANRTSFLRGNHRGHYNTELNRKEM
jgi:hypothetical protein